MRRLRIAGPAAVQLSMGVPADGLDPAGEELWAGLPGGTQARLLSLFARLIARAVIVEEEVEESR